MTQPGLFLTLEGIDGAGKSSHIDALEALFKAQGRQVTRTREPGGTPLAETLRTMVLTQAMDPLTESLLVFAARRDHIVQVIEPALARGDVVLCDRFTDATFAYQGAGRGFDTALLSTLEQWVQARDGGLLQPMLTLWFDLPPETAAERLAGARLPDKFESQPVEFFRRVAAGYAERAAAAPRFVRIDANRPREQVWQQIEAALVQLGLAGSKP
ncbi:MULTISPECIES: dTMP kinase [unclassified Variovorax]|uniref:dTMP kinase n=1 Tax=unclassified Variovorax TaxID=663243 RepID=UPI00076BDEA6|nr:MULTISPECIES: dTMP kinase [unclassified Variovorax]KWT74012.1 Thymidylate kinase [Variovorax sp. WDL1]PNG52345.1 Thymidylate kinase [Variovorax sp. B4]PNG54885.1 Thymidylate kinase [Variovorax sp. B2]VTV15897.1 Thymidylate kinase [Variovorax sp. WDL1]